MSIGGIGGIDSSRIQAMMEQLKAAATKPESAGPVAPAGLGNASAVGGKSAVKLDFAEALHNSLQGVSNRSAEAQALSRRFTMATTRSACRTPWSRCRNRASPSRRRCRCVTSWCRPITTS